MKQFAAGKMFTFRFSSYRFIQYLLIFFVSSGVIAKQTPSKCAANGEYCLNHWDCCSNACLSYLYRCTRDHGVYPYPFLGVSYKPTVTLEQILDQNFGSSNVLPDYQNQAKPYLVNRFAVDEDFAATKINIVTQKPKETTTGTSMVETMGLENLLEPTTLKNLKENDVDSTTLKQLIELAEMTTATLNSLQEEKTEAQTDGGLETTQESVRRSSEKPSCAKIGEKCYQHEDCCNKLCHGYLHQCVT